MLNDLIAGFRRLFGSRHWEQLLEAAEHDVSALDLLQGNLGPGVARRAGDAVLLKSPGGHRIRVVGEPGSPWPATFTATLQPGLGVVVRRRGQARSGRLDPRIRRLPVDGLEFDGTPAAILRAASPAVCERLGRVLLHQRDTIDKDRVVLEPPPMDLAFTLVERVEDLLALVDEVELRPLVQVLGDRIEQREDRAWGRCCAEALLALGGSSPGFAERQLRLMMKFPRLAPQLASSHAAVARRSLHRLLADPLQCAGAARVLAELPSDPESAAELARHVDVEVALALLHRRDGWMAEPAWACLEEALTDDPTPEALAPLAERAVASGSSGRLLALLAPWFGRVPSLHRPHLARRILERCPPKVALELGPAICDAVAGRSSPLTRPQALQLLPLLPEDPLVDGALVRLTTDERRWPDAMHAITARIGAGRSHTLVDLFAGLAPRMPRPAADDLLQGIATRRVPGAQALLAGFLEHAEEEIVAMAAAPLARCGGHEELMALGRRASLPGTPSELQGKLRAAMDEIEVRLGPVQRGGLSLVAEGGGELALSAEGGTLALDEE